MTVYRSNDISVIPVDRPKRVESMLDVPASGRIALATLKVDIEHDRPSDLRLWLVTPSGRQVLVRDRRRDGFGADAIEVPQIQNEPLQGRWRVRIDDVRAGDGGTLKGWELDVSTYRSPLLIELEFRGLTTTQQDVFKAATERLQRFLVGVRSSALTVQIKASGIEIDGRGGILGQAGPTGVRGADGLPTRGIMEFDARDIVRMEINGSLASLLIHEMGHVLGFGTLFGYHKLVQGTLFKGANAMREYAALVNELTPVTVPLEDEGGLGTASSHWDEEIFKHECFTGYMTGNAQPISRMSVGAFEDLGYEVAYDQADPYLLGMLASPVRHSGHLCAITRPIFEIT